MTTATLEAAQILQGTNKNGPSRLLVTGRLFGALLTGAKKKSWQRPTFPHSYPCSIIGSAGLNFRVRDGNGCDPRGMTTGNSLTRFAQRRMCLTTEAGVYKFGPLPNIL